MGGEFLMSEYAVKVSNLNMYFRNMHAIKNLNININKDNIIGLIGSNGSGKTTFFKLCNGFLEQSSGSIEVLDGNPLTDITIKEQMIYSMHDMPIGDNEKLMNVISYYIEAYPTFDLIFANKLMKLFGINQEKAYKTLSQGTKSSFNFICALATRCKVTMLDEPFIGIDIMKRKMAYEILLRDYMEYPRTMIISSHNLSDLENVLSEMILIDNGSLTFYKQMDEVREMAFRAEGSLDKINEFARSHNIIHINDGMINTFGIFEGSPNSKAAFEAKELGLTISKVTPEDVCVYVTSHLSGGELECLWN